MKTKVIVGIFFLGLVAQVSLRAGAQDAASPSDAIASPSVLPQDGYFAFDEKGDKTDCVASCSPCPRVYGYAEALFLERSNCSDDQPVITEYLDNRDVGPFLSTSDLDFDFDPALRVVAGHRLHNGWAIEGQYLGLFDASASEYLVPRDPDLDLTLPGTIPFAGLNALYDSDRIWVNYSSELHSGELNLVCCCGCCDPCGKGKGKSSCCDMNCRTFEWFVGFRYLNLREHFQIYGEKGIEPGESGTYDLRTSNNLYGAQLGARVRRWGTRLGWEATGKAGMFANDAQQEQYLFDYPDWPAEFPFRPVTSASEVQMSFVGELNLTAIYRLNDVWNLRAGYNLMWITGVALAPDQLDFSAEIGAGNQINSGGSVFLHGVSCGLEARW
jgi:hypothetical protein